MNDDQVSPSPAPRSWWTPVGIVLALACAVRGCGGVPSLLPRVAFGTQREVVGADVDALLRAEVTYRRVTGAWLRFGNGTDAVESLASGEVDAEVAEALQVLGVEPKSERGAFWVQVSAEDEVSVWGVSDLDGDGEPAMWQATEEASASLITTQWDY